MDRAEPHLEACPPSPGRWVGGVGLLGGASVSMAPGGRRRGGSLSPLRGWFHGDGIQAPAYAVGYFLSPRRSGAAECAGHGFQFGDRAALGAAGGGGAEVVAAGFAEVQAGFGGAGGRAGAEAGEGGAGGEEGGEDPAAGGAGVEEGVIAGVEAEEGGEGGEGGEVEEDDGGGVEEDAGEAGMSVVCSQ